jgi:hypothetical protein
VFRFAGVMTRKRKRRPTPKAAQIPTPSPILYFVLLGLVIVFFSLIRLRLRDMPLERDEGEYAYTGQLMLQQIPPYRLAYSMKVPGTHAAYALVMALFGQTPAGIHLGLLLINAATVFSIFLLSRRMFGPLAGLVAGSSYALLSTSQSVLGFAAHASNFVVLPAVGGIIMSVKAGQTGRTIHYLLAGLLAGLAFLCKQPGIFFALFCGVYLAARELQVEHGEWRRPAGRLLMYCAGCAIPFALTCLTLFLAGNLGQMWFWTFSYASKYASSKTLAEGWRILSMNAPAVVRPCLLIWILAGVGIAAVAWDSRFRQHRFFAIELLLFSWAAVCPGFYFRNHYFVFLLPAVSLLAGLAVSSLTHRLFEHSGAQAIAAIPLFVFLFAFISAVVSQREFFFQLDPVSACRRTYRTNPFPEAVVISDYLRREVGEKSSKIAVVGSEPEIYFYSRLHSATGYIYTYPLMEHQEYALAMQKEMAKEIEASQPEYLVFVRSHFSWLPQRDSNTFIFEWFQNYAANYEKVGVADQLRPQTQYIWGAAAQDYQPKSDTAVEIFKRKSS